MEFKGTKGKWEVYTPKHIGCTNVKFGSEELDGYIEFWHHHSIEQEQKANALLISKAPEMLEILQRILTQHDNGDRLDNHDLLEIEELVKQATEL